MIPNRYQPLGLYRNPFGALSPSAAAAAAVVQVGDIVGDIIASLERRNHGDSNQPIAVEVIGRCGRGKTTHLRAIEHAIAGGIYTYIPRWQRHVPIPDAEVMILDEVQRMPRRARRSAFSSGRPLVIGSHWSVARKLKRYGYQVTTFRLGKSSGDIPIEEIIYRRWMLAAIDVDQPISIELDSPSMRFLLRQHGTHVRGMIDYLYERVETHLTSFGSSPLEDPNVKMQIVDSA